MYKFEVPVSLLALNSGSNRKSIWNLNSLIFNAMYLKMEQIATAGFHIWTKDQTNFTRVSKTDTIFCDSVI